MRSWTPFIRLLLLLSVGILLTACASSSGRSNAFSHSSYNFVGLNSTLTSASQAERILGRIQLDIAEVALNLPPSADASSISAADFQLEGSELAQQFYEVSVDGIVHFSAANDYGRILSLGYVVDELEVSDFSVVANVSYATADGVQAQWVTRASVRVAAVGGDAASLRPNRFVAFSGLNSGVVNATVSRSFTGRFEAARAVAEDDEVVFLQSDSAVALVNASDMNYNASANEADVEFFAREEERGEFNFMDLARSGNVTQTLRAQISLTLNEGRSTERTQSLTYTIAARTPLSVVNGDASVSGSFLYLLNQSDQAAAEEDYLNAAGTGYGANVSAVEVSFSFGYEREVLETRAADASNQALRFRAPGTIEENSLGGRAVDGLGNVLSSLGIEARLPSDAAEDGYPFLPTLYYRLVNFEDGLLSACRNRYYVDHQSGASVRVLPQIADAYTLNYEDEAQRVNACRLQAALNGVQYEDVVTDANADYSLARNVEGRTLPEANTPFCANNVTAARADACRYVAEVDISLLDVNEAPRLSVTPQVSSVSEGDVGAASGFAAADLEVIAGEDPSSLTGGLGGLRRLANLTYEDTDQDSTGAALRASGAPQIVAVVPRLPAGAENLFVINEVRDNESALFLNQTALRAVDYETLRASGHSGYSLRLRVRDNSTAGLTADDEFVLGIEDVVYKPVLVGDGYAATSNVNDEVQQILPGFQQFAFNGGPFLGRLRAVDPESNSEAGIVYAYAGVALNVGVTTNPAGDGSTLARMIGANFAVAGDRLNLIGLGLSEVRQGNYLPLNLTAPTTAAELTSDFRIQARAFNEASANRSDEAGRLIEIETKVAHNEDLSASQPLVRFNRGMFIGKVAEGRAGNSRVVGGVLVLDADNDTLALETTQEGSITPFYRLVREEEVLGPTSDLQPQLRASLVALFRSEGEEMLFDFSEADRFVINRITGTLSLRNSVKLDFSERSRYVLLAQVLPSSNATSSLLSDNEKFLLSDYAVVVVNVEDDNAAPEIIELRAVAPGVSIDEESTSVFVEREEQEESQAVLAHLKVRDDNPLPATLSFTPEDIDGQELVDSLFVVERISDSARDAAGGYSADYAVRLQRALDFEMAPRVEEYHTFADGGVYAVNASGEIESVGTEVKQASLVLDARIKDVNEPIELRVTRDAAGMDVLNPGEEARVLETAGVGLAQLVDATGMPLADQSVYIQLDDPEGRVNVSNVPRHRLGVPSALDGVVALEFNGSGPSGPYFQLNITDAVGLENAGDGGLFPILVYVEESETGLASVPVSFLARIVNDPNQGLTSIGDFSDIELSEQDALDLYYGGAASERILVSGLFNLTAVHADYDEFYRGSDVRLADLSVRQGNLAYSQAISDRVLNSDRFGLFDFAVGSGDVGRVDMLLREGRLIDSRLIGAGLTLNVSVEERGSGLAAEIGTMMVSVLPPALRELVFASANGLAAHNPPVYDFAYMQSEYAEALSTAVCETDEGAATGGRINVTIEGRCYATIEVRGPSDERLNVAARQARPGGQGVYTGDLAATLSSSQRPRELGLIFTDAAVEVADLGVYRLTASGDLEEAADFTRYFELSANASYAAAGGASRSALVISQRVYPELNRSNQDALQVLPGGAQYLALDLLPLDAMRPQETLSYFVMAGVEANSGRIANQRAIAQLNFEVVVSGTNEPAFLSELKIMDVFLSNSTQTNISQEDFAALVNNPSAALSFNLVNPDGDNDDDTLDQNASILLEVLDAEGELDGILEAAEGTASGDALVRLGANADSSISVNTTLGETSSEFTGHPFQLARNVYGAAVIRVTITEYQREDPANALATRTEDFSIRVMPRQNAPESLVDVTIGGATSLTEDAAALTDATVTFSLRDADFSETVSQTLKSAVVSIGETQIDGRDAPRAVFGIAGEADVTAAPDRVNGQASVTQAVTYAEHSHGETTFAVALTAQEPRGFTDEQVVTELPAFEALNIDFNVTAVNDPLANCGAGGSPVCDTLENERAQFLLERDFGDGAEPTPNFNDADGPTRTVTREVNLFFWDADLLFDPANADILPQLDTATFSLTQPTSLTGIDDIGDILSANVMSSAPRDEADGSIRVTLSVSLTLTEASYNAINALTEGVNIALAASFADGGDPAVTVTATTEIRVDTAADDAMVGGTAGVPQTPINEESDVATALSVEVMIEDADLARSGGDSYEYTLEVDGDAATDLLGWFNGGTAIMAGRETGVTAGSGSITRRIGFARPADDADVGTHSVSWTIRDSRSNITDDSDPARVLRGEFQLEIADVVEAPVFRRADGTAVAADADAFLVAGDGMNTLTDVNGDTARTLEDLTGAANFRVQWDQWNLPSSAHQLALQYQLNVTANAGGAVLTQTYPAGTQTPQPLLFASGGGLVIGGGGADYDVSFDAAFVDKPEGADEISVNLSALSLRASDFNEGSLHSLSVVSVARASSDAGSVDVGDPRQLIAVRYAENYDAPSVALAADPGTFNRESRVNPGETPEARNQINLTLETPDAYTTDGSSMLSQYFTVRASDPVIAYGEEELENATLAGEVYGVYVDNETLDEVSLADAGGSVSLNVWVGDLQARKGYAIETLPCAARGGETPCAGTPTQLTRVNAIERLDDPARLVGNIVADDGPSEGSPIVAVSDGATGDINLFFYVEERDLLETANQTTGEVAADIQLSAAFAGSINLTQTEAASNPNPGLACLRSSTAAVPLHQVDVARAIAANQITSLDPPENDHTRLLSGRFKRREFLCTDGQFILDDAGDEVLYQIDFEQAQLNAIRPQTSRMPTPGYVAAIAASIITELPEVARLAYQFEENYPFFQREGGIEGVEDVHWLQSTRFLPPARFPGLASDLRADLLTQDTRDDGFESDHLSSVGVALAASDDEVSRNVPRLRLGRLWDLLIEDEAGNYDEVPPATVNASAFNPDARALADVPDNVVKRDYFAAININSSLDLSLNLRDSEFIEIPLDMDIPLSPELRNYLEWYTRIDWLRARNEPNHFLLPVGVRGRLVESRRPPDQSEQFYVIEAANNASHFMRFTLASGSAIRVLDDTALDGSPEHFNLSAEVCEFPLTSLDDLTEESAEESDFSAYRRGWAIDCPPGDTDRIPEGFLDNEGELAQERLIGQRQGSKQTQDIPPPPLLQSSLLNGPVTQVFDPRLNPEFAGYSPPLNITLNLRGDLLPPAADGGPKDYLLNLIATDSAGVSNYLGFVIRIRSLHPPPSDL